MPSVLFVCTANRFRSPLASAFFQKALKESNATGDWSVDSAGTWTSPGWAILPEVTLIASKYHLDLARHRTKLVDGTLLSSRDLILVMESGHKEALQTEFPSSRNRVFLLSEVAEGHYYNIPDPTDSLDTMIEVSENLYDLIQAGFGNICDLATRLHEADDRFESNRG